MRPELAAYCDELHRLTEAQKEAAQTFAAHTLYLREELAGRRIAGARRVTRERLAEEAAEEWLRLSGEIDLLNAAGVSR